jgi:multiple antibiotic resistance protein
MIGQSKEAWTSTCCFGNRSCLPKTVLLPLINPIGSALIFLGLVGDEPAQLYRQIARRVAIATVGFLVVIQCAQ